MNFVVVTADFTYFVEGTKPSWMLLWVVVEVVRMSGVPYMTSGSLGRPRPGTVWTIVFPSVFVILP